MAADPLNANGLFAESAAVKTRIYELLIEGDFEGHLRRLGLEGVPAAAAAAVPPPAAEAQAPAAVVELAEIIVDDTMPPAGAAIRPPPSARAASEVFSSRTKDGDARGVGMWRVAALSAPDAGITRPLSTHAPSPSAT